MGREGEMDREGEEREKEGEGKRGERGESKIQVFDPFPYPTEFQSFH